MGHISLTRKIVSEYDLYCVEWDVKPYYTIRFKWSITRALNSKEIPTVKALRELAKERGLKRYSELNKDKLLKQLEIKVDQNPHRIYKKMQEQAEELNWNGITASEVTPKGGIEMRLLLLFFF